MPSLSRRDALRAGVAVAAGVPLAGCSSGPELAEFRLEELRVLNTHTEPHTVSVMLFEDGEPVYRGTMDAEAAEAGDGSTTEAGGGTFEGTPTDPGRYELYAWLQQGEGDEWNHFALDPEDISSDSDPLCVQAVLFIEAAPENGAQSVFLRSLGCEK